MNRLGYNNNNNNPGEPGFIQNLDNFPFSRLVMKHDMKLATKLISALDKRWQIFQVGKKMNLKLVDIHISNSDEYLGIFLHAYVCIRIWHK